MSSFGWIGAIVVAAGLGSAPPGVDGSRNGRVTPIVTQRTTFAIPFRVPAAAHPQLAPVQIVLFYSRNRGESWELYGQVAPERGHFVFQADGDGDYWFTIQSRDRAGNAWPRFTGVPGLRVRVDATPPQVDVSAWRGEGRQVTARWRIDEANLRSDGVSVEYRFAGDSDWRDVALAGRHQSQSGDAALGEVAFQPEAEARALEVRVEAVDLAGNRSAGTTTVETATGAPPLDRVTAAPPQEATTADPPPLADTYGQPWPAQPSTDDEPSGAGVAAVEASRQPWPAQPHPPLASQYQPETTLETVSSSKPTWTASHPDQVRPVNARLFELEFDVESVDPSTISHIELWATRDGGRSWRSVSLHQNGRSPILAKVDEEGTYGFQIVVHGRLGPGRKPQPGDKPDIWVRVDLTKPVAAIVSAEEGTGPESGHLVIRWTAEDEELAAAPISLAYSNRPGGPWTSIARELADTGRYAWPLPAAEQGPIYLRLEARDAAGNLAEFETAQPVVLDRAPPRVHVREVRPLSDTSQGSGPRRYIFR